ncbi:hypothetical protein SVIOM342S_06850 [Streptomyces violaceorubidus]
MLLLVEDLTEARRIEAYGDFVANVSHELKTPVGALSLLSEAVMDAADDPEPWSGSPAGCRSRRPGSPTSSRS